jgi:hypothetical protein
MSHNADYVNLQALFALLGWPGAQGFKALFCLAETHVGRCVVYEVAQNESICELK